MRSIAPARAPLLALCVALVVSGAVGLGLVSAGPSAAARGAGSAVRAAGRGAPSVAQAQAVLDDYGTAVRQRRGLASLLDGDPAAAAFRDRATAEYTALAAVPLRSWSYRLAQPVTGGAALDSADRRYGRPVLIARVSLSYALAGVDALPSSHDLWWTFVVSEGHVVVAGDDDLADQGGVSWRGPWDFGPLRAARGRYSLVLVHADRAGLLPSLVAGVDAAVPVVSSVWGTGWSQQVAVLVPDSEAELQELVGGASSDTDIAAVAVADADPDGAPPSGQRVVLDPVNLGRLDAVGRRIVLQHEITHVASRAATGSASPTWLIEGLAEYVGNLGSGQPVGVAAAELAQDVHAGRSPVSLPDSAAFTGGAAPAAYEQAWLACRLIAARVGPAGLVAFYRTVGGSLDDPDAAVNSAFSSMLHTTTAGFTSEWRAYVEQQLT